MIKLALAALLLAAPACAAAPKKPEVKKPMTEWKGQFGGSQTAGHRVVSDETAWKKLWSEIGKPIPTTVDFAAHVAVAVFLGPRNTGGYTVAWKTVEEDGERALLRYSILPPKGMAMQALTQPWTVKLFPKPGKPLAVETE